MRGRAAGAIFALTVVGAVAFDALLPAEPPVPRAVAVSSAAGVLACPFASEGSGNAYLHLANVGTTRAGVRVTVVPARGRPVVLSSRVDPGQVRTVRLHQVVKGKAGAIVEYAGGEVVASHTLWLANRDGPRGGGGGTCMRAASSETVIPHIRTLGAETRLGVVNPGGGDADVTVMLFADGRMIAPEGLSQRVVPARGRRDFRLGDFAFDARSLTAVVRSSAGRVVAEGLVVSRDGVELIGGQAPAGDLAGVAARTGPGSSFSLTTVGEDDAGIDARLVTGSRQGKAPRIPPALAPGQTSRVAIPDTGRGAPAAYVSSVTVGSPLAAGASWLVAGNAARDPAAAEAVPFARRWAGVIGTAQRRSSARAILLNPGPEAAVVRYRVLTGGGARGERSLSLPAGRLALVGIGRGNGVFGLEARSDVPVAVVLEGAATSPQRQVFGFGIPATPLYPAAPVVVTHDPRIGVPAPLTPF